MSFRGLKRGHLSERWRNKGLRPTRQGTKDPEIVSQVRGMNLTRENGRIELSPGEVFECLHEQVNGVKDDVLERRRGELLLRRYSKDRFENFPRSWQNR